MTDKETSENLVATLTALPVVKAVSEVELSAVLIKRIMLETAAFGKAVIDRLNDDNVNSLFAFYTNGLSARSREYFPPYPLFSPAPESAEQLGERLREWQREDDWVFFLLHLAGKVAGCCLLKRYRTPRPTSGLAVGESFQQQGLGVLLQTVVNEQAKLLGLKRLTITLAPDNIASLNVHFACGFVVTGIRVPHYGYREGQKIIDRYDTEMERGF